MELLQDTSSTVLYTVAKNLGTTFSLFYQDDPDDRQAAILADMIGHIGAMETPLSHQWRHLDTYVESLQPLTEFFTADQIFTVLAPVMFNIIAANNMLQVKHQAIRTLAIFIHKNNRRDNREHLMEK